MSQNLRNAIGAAITLLQAALDDTPEATTPMEMLAQAFATMQAKAPDAPMHAKADMPLAPSTSGRAGLPPTVVYTMKPGYSKTVANAQTAINGKVLAAVLKANPKGIGARTIAEKYGIKSKSVQSAVFHLRHAGLIRSVSIETGKPIE